MIIDMIIQDHLPSSTSMTVDLYDGYSFPTHIADTDLRTNMCAAMWPEDRYTDEANSELWNFLWGSNHEERTGTMTW